MLRFLVRLRHVAIGFHLWDLDAPCVALAWQWLFARCVYVSIAWPAVAALAVTVWLIYAADRVLDVRSPGASPSTARHAFHTRHRWQFTVLAGFALGALLGLSFLLRPVLLRAGLALASCVAGYLACVHLAWGPPRRWIPKELVVGVLFAAGTCLAPWSRALDRPALVVPGLCFALLCCLNCTLIEVWEWRDSGSLADKRPHSWTIWLWRTVRPLLVTLAASSAALWFCGVERPLFSAILLSACFVLLLDFYKQRLSPDGRRVLADAALLTPLLFLLAGR